MKVMSRFGRQALVDEPSLSDQRVKFFKELSRLGGSGLSRNDDVEAIVRHHPESGVKDPGRDSPKE